MKKLLFGILAAISLSGMAAEEKLIVVDEGSWQGDNGRLSYFQDNQIVSNQWFRENNGYKLGDTPSDIIRVNDDLIAIAVRNSNIIQWIHPNGKAAGVTDNLPNLRCLATDGSYVYVTSYAHECETTSGILKFQKGFVAKIDINSGFKVVAACETGYEPEGVALYNGTLFVANSGGYSFQEDHDYETTIYMIDAATMKYKGMVETGHPNLYGRMSKSGKYLCVNSTGNYYDKPGCGIIVDCEKALTVPEESFATIPVLVTYNCEGGENKFYAIGSEYSFLTSSYIYTCITLDAKEIINSKGAAGLKKELPGTMVADIEKMTSPYGIYMNPYTGYLYATDAGTYGSVGKLYQWSPDGKFIDSYNVYINPGWFLALPPDSYNSVDEISAFENSEKPVYDLQGRRIQNPVKGQIYITGGKKILW